eukprot:m.31224 g.31224  ORF g.31224 m.31224 type:complete len:130 (+) comp12297_c0_seq1:20-409(+)
MIGIKTNITHPTKLQRDLSCQPTMADGAADTAVATQGRVCDGADWENDAQFRAMALDRKLEAEENYAQFMEENPDARAICSDFLKHLLVFKPEDTVAEAKAYFANFVAPPPPSSEGAVEAGRPQPLRPK